MYGCEALAAALEQNPDQINNDRAVAHRGLDRGGMAEIGLHGMDLPHPAERLQRAGEIGATHGGAHAVPVPGERPHHMSTEETGGADDRRAYRNWKSRSWSPLPKAQGRPRRTGPERPLLFGPCLSLPQLSPTREVRARDGGRSSGAGRQGQAQTAPNFPEAILV
jgi:hypothetical protein